MAEGESTRHHADTEPRPVVVFACIVVFVLAWLAIAQGPLALGPSEWDDAMYCDRAASGALSWDSRNRSVHVWSIRGFFGLFAHRGEAAGHYATTIVLVLSMVALALGRALGGWSVGLLAMAAMPLYAPFTKYLTVPHVDLTLALWTLSATASMILALQAEGPRTRWTYAMVAGATCVLALKSKETALCLLPILGYLIIARGMAGWRLLVPIGAGAVGAFLLLFGLDLAITPEGHFVSGATVTDYFTHTPPGMTLPAKTISRWRMRHNLLSELIRPPVLAFAMMAFATVLRDFRRVLAVRALGLLFLGLVLVTAYASYVSKDLEFIDRYMIAMGPPLMILSASYGVELWRRDGEASRDNLIWLPPLVLGLGFIVARALLALAQGSDDYAHEAARFFLLPILLLLLFWAPYLNPSPWVARVSLVSMLVLGAAASLVEAREHVVERRTILVPWLALAEEVDRRSGAVAVYKSPYLTKGRVRFRLGVLSHRPASRLKIRSIASIDRLEDGELLFSSGAPRPVLVDKGFRVIAKFSEGRSRKHWTAYSR